MLLCCLFTVLLFLKFVSILIYIYNVFNNIYIITVKQSISNYFTNCRKTCSKGEGVLILTAYSGNYPPGAVCEAANRAKLGG